MQAEARGSLQVLLAIRDANPGSELRSWWQGGNYAAWRGVKVQHGEVVELCAPGRALSQLLQSHSTHLHQRKATEAALPWRGTAEPSALSLVQCDCLCCTCSEHSSTKQCGWGQQRTRCSSRRLAM